MLSNVGRLLRQRLALPLPGSEAHYKMANADRRINLSRFKIPDNPRRSAVLIMLYETDQGIKFPLITNGKLIKFAICLIFIFVAQNISNVSIMSLLLL